MAANKIVTFGPVALSATLTTNILSPSTLRGGTGMPSGTNTYIILRHIRIVNKTAGAVTCSFWKDATGGNTAGKEIIGTGLSIPANSYVDWYGMLRISASETDKFLVGGASAGASLTFQAEGEFGIE